jgi:hypothetical protein
MNLFISVFTRKQHPLLWHDILYIYDIKQLIIMTTITINERTKAGKALLEMAKLLAVTNKGVEINEKSPYNPEFVEKILEAEKRGNYKTIDPDDVWGSLGLK